MKITLPTRVLLRTRKRDKKDIYFNLNLNVYRNTHHRVLSDAKTKYKELIWDLIPDKVYDRKIKLSYMLYTKTKRKVDVSNVLSIVDKFFCDTLVEKGIIEDDNYDWLTDVFYSWGGHDPDAEESYVKVKIL